jgi:DNA topoisomerase-1
MLGNTPTICRKCYIHPAIFEGYLDGSLLTAPRNARNGSGDDLIGLKPDEVAVARFLRERLGEQ